MDLTKLIRTIPNYPKPGVMFRDISTLLGHARRLREAGVSVSVLATFEGC